MGREGGWGPNTFLSQDGDKPAEVVEDMGRKTAQRTNEANGEWKMEEQGGQKTKQ